MEQECPQIVEEGILLISGIPFTVTGRRALRPQGSTASLLWTSRCSLKGTTLVTPAPLMSELPTSATVERESEGCLWNPRFKLARSWGYSAVQLPVKCSVFAAAFWLAPRLPYPYRFPSKATGDLPFLKELFPTQGSNRVPALAGRYSL